MKPFQKGLVVFRALDPLKNRLVVLDYELSDNTLKKRTPVVNRVPQTSGPYIPLLSSFHYFY